MFLAWFLPDGNLSDAAKKARVEFRRALGSYVDLVALERNAGGSGTRQALENAARVGDAWPFHRIGDALARSRYSGDTAWDALHDLAAEHGLTDLDDLADIMRLAGEEGSQVVDTLRGPVRRTPPRDPRRGPGAGQHRRRTHGHPLHPDGVHLRRHPPRPRPAPARRQLNHPM